MPNPQPTLKAGGDIYPARFVKLSPAEPSLGVQADADTDKLIGIAQMPTRLAPIDLYPIDGRCAASGDSFRLLGLGDITYLEAGSGGFTAGDEVSADSLGRGITLSGVGFVGALALETAASGKLGAVQVALYQKPA